MLSGGVRCINTYVVIGKTKGKIKAQSHCGSKWRVLILREGKTITSFSEKQHFHHKYTLKTRLLLLCHETFFSILFC